MCLMIFFKNVVSREPFSTTLDAVSNFYNKEPLYKRLVSLKEIIQNWKTLKNVMGLQDQAFENCEKWMQGYKGWKSNLDKCLSPLNSLLMAELPSSFHKIGV